MRSKKNWELKIDSKIYKDLKKISKKDVVRIVEAIEEISHNPYRGDIEKIKGEKNLWRKRIRAYRVFYDIEKSQRVIKIICVERRTSKTYSNANS
jgi:mRNA-degrading endonuclease RelE of RelBE toxin-antitoxin system